MRPLGAATFSAPIEPPRMATALFFRRRRGRKIGSKRKGRLGGRLGGRRRQQRVNDCSAASLGRAAAGAAVITAPHPNTRHDRNRLRNHRDRRRRGRRRNTGSGKGFKLVKIVPQLLDIAGALGRVGRGQRQDGGEQVHGRGWEDGGRGEVEGGKERSAQILKGGGDGFHPLGRHRHGGGPRRGGGEVGLAVGGGWLEHVNGCEKLCCA